VSSGNQMKSKMKLLTNHNRQGEENEQYVWC
jgi:hypothetical protein